MRLCPVESVAEFEKVLIQKREMGGLDCARSEGKTLGRPPGSKDTKKRYTRRDKHLRRI